MLSLLNIARAVAIAALSIGSVTAACAQDSSKPVYRTSKTAVKRLTGVRKGPTIPLTPARTADAILSDVLDQLTTQGDRHFHEGEYNHVVNLNRVVVQGNPGDLDAFANNAWLLWSTDRNDQAIATLKQGLTANPDTYYMYDELGEHYLVRLKDAKSALPYLEKAVKFTCPYSVWHSLARAYEMTNQLDKAVTTWEWAAKHYPEDNLAPIRAQRARKQLAAQKGEPNNDAKQELK